MTTSIAPRQIDMAEFEFSSPCQIKGCDTEALIALSISHSQDGCWSPSVFFCLHHFKRKRAQMDDWIKRCQTHNRRCARCRQFIIGTLQDNTRLLWL